MGGKSTTVEAQKPAPMNTKSSIGNQLSAKQETVSDVESKKKESAIDKKKVGTRGLRIPLTAKSSTTTTSTNNTSKPSKATAANTGAGL